MKLLFSKIKIIVSLFQGLINTKYILFVILVFSVCLTMGCSSIINGADEKDTYFNWERQQASKSWGKEPPKLETMFGFRLRMSKLEYESTFDSLILVGLANEERQIRFGDTFDEYFEVEPHYHNDTLFQIDFQIQPTLTNADTIIRAVNMLTIIEKLYTNINVKKSDTTFDSDHKIISYVDAYGWVDNNRLIKVYRRVYPDIILLRGEFDNVEFIDLTIKMRHEASLLNQEKTNIDTVRINKLKNISK